jgi:multidrug efflux system membrane fusion protein
VPLDIRTFGTVEASATVAVKAQVTGMLTVVHFREGQDVKKDDLLFSVDSAPFEAALKQAEAVLLRDRIQWTNAQADAGRVEALFGKGMVSQNDRDQARAAADTLGATVKADEAAVENARIQLGYCTIRSPMDGRTGNRMTDVGNLVKANDATLVTIVRLQPVNVSFVVPQQSLPAIRRYMAEAPLQVTALAPDVKDKPAVGTLVFVDNAVDAGTGTVRLKGAFANDDTRLWPGQFVGVSLLLTTQTNALVLPSAAVQTGQRGTYVFVVNQDSSVSNRPVVVERTYEDADVIASGLTAGERVVLDGQLRLTPNAKVVEAQAQPKSGNPGARRPADDRPAGRASGKS